LRLSPTYGKIEAMAVRIAINGFGRIGRTFFKQAVKLPDFEIVAINDLGGIENLAYLLQHDSVYGPWLEAVGYSQDELLVAGKKIKVLKEKDPAKLPWGDLNIDVVLECTGAFESHDQAEAHLHAGARRVVITASPHDTVTPVFTPNVGEDSFDPKDKITSNGSCTTNAVTPLMKILDQEIGIAKSMLATVHGYTASQSLVDGPDKQDDFRRGRAGGANIVPYGTGAAVSATRAYPALVRKFDGLSFRVPVFSGSIIDFTWLAKRPTSMEEVNSIIKQAAAQPEWQGILTFTEEPLVSSDILGNPHGSIVDLGLTRVVAGDLVKVCSWYDNEWGYVAMLVKHVKAVSKLL